MTQDPYIKSLKSEIADLKAEVTRQARIIKLAEMLIQPSDDGAELVGHRRFKSALLGAVRGLKFPRLGPGELADKLAYEVARAIERGTIRTRSAIDDALLDYLNIGGVGGPDTVPAWMEEYQRTA